MGEFRSSHIAHTFPTIPAMSHGAKITHTYPTMAFRSSADSAHTFLTLGGPGNAYVPDGPWIRRDETSAYVLDTLHEKMTHTFPTPERLCYAYLPDRQASFRL